MFPSGYSSRQSMQNSSSVEASGCSSANSLRLQQTQSSGGQRHHLSRSTYLRDTFEHESVMEQLLSPSSPPSLDQLLSAEHSNSNSNSQRPIQISNSRHQSIYDDIERELLAETSSSSQQPDAGAMPTNSNSRYQCLYNEFAQELSTLSTTPTNFDSSSRQQFAANESTSRTLQASSSRYPGVTYKEANRKWHARWMDPSQKGRRVWIGSFNTQSEAIEKLEGYKASRSEMLSQVTNSHTGLFKNRHGKWVARYYSQGKHVHVGTFKTSEEAQRALQEHRAKNRLPPMSARRKKE